MKKITFIAICLSLLTGCSKPPEQNGGVKLGEGSPSLDQRPSSGSSEQSGKTKSLGYALKEKAMAKQVYLTCKTYADDHDGSFPKDLGDLCPEYTQAASLFVSSFGPSVKIPDIPSEPVAAAKVFQEFIHTSCGYDYAGGKLTDPPHNVLLHCKYAGPDNLKTVVYVNGDTDRVAQ